MQLNTQYATICTNMQNQLCTNMHFQILWYYWYAFYMQIYSLYAWTCVWVNMSFKIFRNMHKICQCGNTSTNNARNMHKYANKKYAIYVDNKPEYIKIREKNMHIYAKNHMHNMQNYSRICKYVQKCIFKFKICRNMHFAFR